MLLLPSDKPILNELIQTMQQYKGHKKENLNKLKEMYDVDIAVKPDENMKPGKFEINVVETYK